MSGLFASLSSASRALEAQQFGLTVAGQNIANAGTDGYSRRTIGLQTSLDGGVEVSGVRAIRDTLIATRLISERPAAQREAVLSNALSVVEVVIGDAGKSIDAKMSAFFDAASDLSADPTSSTAREDFVSKAGQVASAFRQMSSSLSAAARDADANIRATVDEVNQKLTSLANLNAALSKTTDDATKLSLQDQQQAILDGLSGLMDISVLSQSDGSVEVAAGGGQSLVLGNRATTIGVTSTSPNGYADLTVGGVSITADVTSGTLGGYLYVRDSLVPDYHARLDELASTFASEVNAVHQDGYDMNGDPGLELFSVSATGHAAATISVNSAIVSDGDLVAAAGGTVSGDNSNATALAALRDTEVLNGGTFTEAWAQIVYRVASDVESANDALTSQQAVVDQLEALSDSVSGVSLDDEAVTLLQFQRAYEANAKYFQVIDEAIQTVIGLVG
jgi:flagellar hook-associated protein 1 FlgK